MAGAGLATLPFAFVTAGFSPAAMLLMRRAGTKLVVAAGLVMMSAGFMVAAARLPRPQLPVPRTRPAVNDSGRNGRKTARARARAE